MVFTACVIYNGKEHYLGLSTAFEFPPKVIRLIQEENLDINEAYFKCGLTKNKKIGSSQGVIGLLTKGRITRKDYTEGAIKMALIQVENRDLYNK